MKVYTARQTTTLFKMLLWPDTTIKVICLNMMINLPNTAYKEFREEMNFQGMELRVHDKIKSKDAGMEAGMEIPFILKANAGESLGSLLERGNKVKGGADNNKPKKSLKQEEKVAALYFVSSPFVIYAGQALKLDVHQRTDAAADPVVDYKNNKGDHPDPQIVPIGIVPTEERYRWEFHLHICSLLASLFQLPNCINASEYTAQAHPLSLNKQTNSTFIDKKSWDIINAYMMKNFKMDVYLGPKGVN